MSASRLPHRSCVLLAVLAVLPLVGCGGDPDLVVYCALDSVFAEELIQDFEHETGVRVDAQFDVEAHKTVGLVGRIFAEQGNPQCDVFWNNEIAHTVRLSQAGLLLAYDSPSARDIPEVFRDVDRTWTGFAARARVLIVNTDEANPAEIGSMWDVLDPKWAGKVTVAKPLTGTTLTHFAALYDVIGQSEAQRYIAGIAKAGAEGTVRLASSNGQVMRLVGEGEMAFGWTDTDDLNVAVEKGYPVVAVYPDQDTIGTLVIPNTVAILKNAPHLVNAKLFVDWVLQKKIEERLAASRSAQIPVRADVPRPKHVRGPEEFRNMAVSYVGLGKQIAFRADQFREIFLR